MKRCLFIIILVLLPALLAAQPLRFAYTAVVGNQVGLLSWNRLPNDSVYSLYRMFHDEEDYTRIATIADTFYYDTLHRTICADTVNYFVAASSDTSLPAGLFYHVMG